MAKKPLSDRQQRMLEFIGMFSNERGYPPTIRDIGSELGISSTSVVSYNLKILEKEGLIERDETVSRGLKVVHGDNGDNRGASRRTVSVPILGAIAAGQPLSLPDAGQYEPSDFVELTKDIVADAREIYALRVKGNSMIDALVNDGDLVILKRQEKVENGQMAAVWLDEEGETTLKYFYLEGERVRLKPANPTMQAWYVPAENVRVQGKVIAVIRQV
jgi:repressor LexA